MLAAVPRYLAGGHQTRLSLLLMAMVVVVVVALLQWRLLAVEARACLPALLRRLGLCLVAGLVVMSGWHALVGGGVGWAVLISHGATLGLLLHALWLWVKAPS
nr:hypothetical protein [Halomonas cerina]